MIRFLLRTLWRALIFLLGVASLIFVVYAVWPDSGSRTALFFALLVIYCLMAYVIIPNLFRVYHVFIKHDHIPLYVTTSDGWASDPVNLAIICKNERRLIQSMQHAGWYKADPPTLRNSFQEARSILFDTSYPAAPVSGLYLFNRRHDIAFEIPTNPRMSARTRHHVRFWKLEEPRPNSYDHDHFKFWSDKLQGWIKPSRQVWIGACTEDTSPLGLRYRTGTLTHRISGDSDKERDYIVETLHSAGEVRDIHKTEPSEQLKFRSQQAHVSFITDGSIKVVNLK